MRTKYFGLMFVISHPAFYNSSLTPCMIYKIHIALTTYNFIKKIRSNGTNRLRHYTFSVYIECLLLQNLFRHDK